MKKELTPVEAKRKLNSVFDEMKSEYEFLWKRYVATVHENALLSAEVDRLRYELKQVSA